MSGCLGLRFRVQAEEQSCRFGVVPLVRGTLQSIFAEYGMEGYNRGALDSRNATISYRRSYTPNLCKRGAMAVSAGATQFK